MDNSKLPTALHFKVEKKQETIIDEKPNIEPIISDDLEDEIPFDEPEQEATEQMGIKVVKRPKIKPEKIFEEPPKKSRKQIKYVEVSSSEEELEPEPEPEPEEPEEPQEPPPEPKIQVYEEVEETPKEKPKKAKKQRKPMTEQRKMELRKTLEKARQRKQELIAEKKKATGYKTSTEIRAEREKVKMDKHKLEMKRLQEELEEEKKKVKEREEKILATPEPAPIPKNYITKEDLEKSQLNTLATFEMMRKERKEEKKKKKQVEAYNESVKETIKNINKSPHYMRKAGKYKNYLDF
tara:strand:+ start:11941 stop:12825 length:885 start_codon:yes stop_codon:yes gene_type:complete